MAGQHQLFLGTFVHSKKLDELEYLHDTAVCVNKEGRIICIERDCSLEKAQEQLFPKLGWSPEDVATHVRDDGQFFFPGFVGE